ncbi:ABC transporter substrate-binding protein [Salipiger sp. P9]|uniref:ABC transporter substrate-binding protein n=1 Tax=Salipiger pentaromativorans TaxID=2943193 RepID=UPI00215868F0|nr:ABC transporter substrate-binding protein [Salipiger pentaromativorans]MCR8547506.1 ABC transporter substrate-binding protein [Salipiger pentaromativorans]
MRLSGKTRLALSAALALALTGPAYAQTSLTWSTGADLITLDPHAASVGINNTGLGQIYEPLITRDQDLKLTPALATEWKSLDDTTWEFKLREGVSFHDGSPFTAEDAAFSINRAKAPTSDYKVAVAAVSEVEILDDYTIHIKTAEPAPTLPDWLTTIFVMDSGWAETNDVLQPQDFKGGDENYAARHANGTGPFLVTERIPGVRTAMDAFEGYWDREHFPLTYTQLIHIPIASAPTRVAGLISGELDIVLDPPLQDLARIEADPALKVETGNEIRSIFFGFDVESPTLRFGSGTETNPFLDPRVRRAVYLAINSDGIQRQIMRGLSTPVGTLFSPRLNGHNPAFVERLATDPEAAKALMAEAGYADGFKVRLDCTNNRYVNDEAICQAVVPMLARIGIEVELNSRPATQAFPDMLNRNTSFFMLGFDAPTMDAEYIFRYILHTPDGTLGTWNFGNYSNPEVDTLLGGIATELDLDKRREMMARVIEITRDETVYVPLHLQGLAWAMKKSVALSVRSDNKPQFKYAHPAE